MDTERLKNEIGNIALSLGADITGFGPLVSEKFPEYTSVVSVGVKLLDSIIDSISAGPTMTYYHHYRTVNSLLDMIALRLAKHLEISGYVALPVPASQTVDAKSHTALFQHKTAAVSAGLGWIGRSALLVTPQYGPRVRLVTVLTNAPLGTETPLCGNGCNECRVCVNMCPAGAIKGDKWSPDSVRDDIYDAHKCSDYMRNNYSGVGRGSVCGICMSACPYGRK